MTNDYRSLVLAAGEKYRLVPFDVSFTEALFEAVRESRTELLRSCHGVVQNIPWKTPGVGFSPGN